MSSDISIHMDEKQAVKAQGTFWSSEKAHGGKAYASLDMSLDSCPVTVYIRTIEQAEAIRDQISLQLTLVIAQWRADKSPVNS